MLARLRVLLPYTFSIPQDEQLASFDISYPPYLVRVFPPLALEIDASSPLLVLSQSLRTAASAQATDAVLVNGIPTRAGNVLQIDLIKSEFDRRRSGIGNLGGEDPPTAVLFFLVNMVLNHIRAVTAGTHIKTLDPNSSIWYMRYLADDESELAEDPSLARGRAATGFQRSVSVVNSTNWSVVSALPIRYALPTWNEILLDAGNLLPEIGPALVLAFAAMRH